MRRERKVLQVQKLILPWALEDLGMKFQSKLEKKIIKIKLIFEVLFPKLF